MIKRGLINLLFVVIYFSTSVSAFASEQTDSIQKLIELGRADTLSAEENISLGKTLLAKDLKKALRHFENVIYSQKIIDRKLLSVAYENAAIVCIKQGEQTIALALLDSALKISEQLGSKRGIASVTLNKGNAYYALGDYAKSLEYILASYKMQLELNDSLGIAKTINNLASIYLSQHEDDKALEWYQKGISILSALGNKGTMVSALNNIGQVYTRKMQYDDAIKYYQRSISIAIPDGNPDGAITAFLGISDIYTTKNNLNEAIFYLKKAESLIDQTGNIFKQNHMYIVGGTIYEKKKDYETAIVYYEKALKSSEALGMKIFESDALLALSGCYKKLNKYETALNYLDQYANLNDSMRTAEKIKQIAEMHTKFETENKQKEDVILEGQLKLKSLELKTNQLLLISLGVLLVFLIVLGGLIFRNSKIKLEHRSLQLEQKLLRTQMNPHFIFNALITIEGYIYENEPKQAGKYLSDFSRLMRLILESSLQEYIPLKKELETLKFYLELQKLRMDDKFSYTIDTSLIENLEEVHIPPMLTQPFIENSIEHGFRGKTNHGHISIEYKLTGKNDLQVTVIDNGAGINYNQQAVNESEQFHRPSAIQITKERLVVLNKSKRKKVQFRISDLSDEGKDGTGTKVVFTVPLMWN